ncbi:RNA-binding transcriptional accessory protein [Aerococcaceae bacterium NML180378]|nr:RNA-binding transcriptional accessory protein [Aerococcaceae bacterium NML180378]
MEQHLVEQVAQELNIPLKQVEATLALLAEGNTIPFIARYRKEVTGALDEVQIHAIEQRHHYMTQLAGRKEEVTRLIAEQDKLTDELVAQINKATTLQQVEDIYRPYKQKRRTKAMIAIENGLEPLADWLLSAENTSIATYAEQFVGEQVPTGEEALQGAHEILAQRVSDNAAYREFIRKYARYNGEIQSTLKDADLDEQQVYRMYYEHREKLANLAAHRTLAMNRAEKEGVLSIKIVMDEALVLNYLTKRFIEQDLPNDKRQLVERAIEDGYKRFIAPVIERELRNEATENADKQAIQVFSENLRNLLLTPPLKGKIVLGFDPAYRTGCKLAIINETGRVLDKGVIYPHKPAPQHKREAALSELRQLVEQYQVDVIAIGNGTASRESEQFVAELIKTLDRKVQFLVVNEAGASVYSASELAREEFPDFQVEERSAVSIARRLQDPLAELIKIDPKSMGVGQYQHDVAQKLLTEELDFVVNTTVNQVGVDINTASVSLLQHVSGLTAATAKNVIQLRDELGRFNSREQIKKVKRLGPKTYEQAVGFLRIVGGDNPLDQTGIHPESYHIAGDILQVAQVSVEEIGSDHAVEQLALLQPKQVAQQLNVGAETVADIIEGLKHPLHDIREAQPTPILREDVMSMDDLEVGMQLQGAVRNVVDFGAFVDIGVKQDGLIHVSKLSKQYIKHPLEAVSVGDIVDVEVIQLDRQSGRIGLKRLFPTKGKATN